MAKLDRHASQYNGFNLLAGEGGDTFWYSNQDRTIVRVPAGTHGVSNHLLNTPWPKVVKGKKALEHCLADSGSPLDPEALFSLLSDKTRPRDSALPHTGVGLEWERRLSPLFIQSPTYGTRSSTLVMVYGNGRIRVVERTYDPDGAKFHEDQDFTIEPD